MSWSVTALVSVNIIRIFPGPTTLWGLVPDISTVVFTFTCPQIEVEDHPPSLRVTCVNTLSLTHFFGFSRPEFPLKSQFLMIIGLALIPYTCGEVPPYRGLNQRHFSYFEFKAECLKPRDLVLWHFEIDYECFMKHFYFPWNSY